MASSASNPNNSSKSIDASPKSKSSPGAASNTASTNDASSSGYAARTTASASQGSPATNGSGKEEEAITPAPLAANTSAATPATGARPFPVDPVVAELEARYGFQISIAFCGDNLIVSSSHRERRTHQGLVTVAPPVRTGPYPNVVMRRKKLEDQGATSDSSGGGFAPSSSRSRRRPRHRASAGRSGSPTEAGRLLKLALARHFTKGDEKGRE